MGYSIQTKGVNGDIFACKVKVYDADEQTLIAQYPSIRQASKHTGASESTILYSKRNRTKTNKNSLGKNLAFR